MIRNLAQEREDHERMLGRWPSSILEYTARHFSALRTHNSNGCAGGQEAEGGSEDGCQT